MLQIEGLTRYYGKFLALDHLNMHIGPGELHGFVGPNGAGKTTTMRILSTLLLPSEGKVTLNDVDLIRNPKQIRRMIGYMPDFFGVYDRLKTMEYLDFYARCYGFSYRERARMVDSLLELVNLEDKRDEYVDVLSRGMKQRLCLARALIHDPCLLILDEPASGMDPRARAEMKAILKSLKDMEKTVLISSHILPELSEMCDSLTIIDKGQLVFTGPVDALAGRMSGNTHIEMRLLPDEEDGTIQRALSMLKQIPGVAGIVQEDPTLFVIEFIGGDQEIAQLLRQSVSQLPVVSFHRVAMNLEKVFMEVTKDD